MCFANKNKHESFFFFFLSLLYDREELHSSGPWENRGDERSLHRERESGVTYETSLHTHLPQSKKPNLPSLNALMHAIRHDEKSKKKLNLVVIHFSILLSFGKLLLKCFFLPFFFSLSLSLSFFCCNLNGKPPDVCLMLEEPELCII